MFEQNSPQTNSNSNSMGNQNNPADGFGQGRVGGLTPPPNLPTGNQAEPEDMLADIDPSAGQKNLGRLSAQERQAQLRQPIIEAVESSRVPVDAPAPIERKDSSFKYVAKIIGIIIVVAVVGGGIGVAGWWGYNRYVVKTNQPQDAVNGPVSTQQNSNEPAVNTVNEAPVVPEKPLDSDSDGLPDSEEQLYGTNPQSADTDSDGLTDRDEVRVFGTDPNNPDSDGDGFKDGDEVNNGYDPKGTGVLLDLDI